MFLILINGSDEYEDTKHYSFLLRDVQPHNHLRDVQPHNHNSAKYYYFILLFRVIACFIKVFL